MHQHSLVVRSELPFSPPISYSSVNAPSNGNFSSVLFISFLPSSFPPIFLPFLDERHAAGLHEEATLPAATRDRSCHARFLSQTVCFSPFPLSSNFPDVSTGRSQRLDEMKRWKGHLDGGQFSRDSALVVPVERRPSICWTTL